MNELSEILRDLLNDSYNPFEETETIIAAEEVDPIAGRQFLGVVGPDGNELPLDQVPPEVKAALISMGLIPADDEDAPTMRVRVSIVSSGNIAVEEEEKLDMSLATHGLSFVEALMYTAAKAVSRAVKRADELGG